MARYRKIDTRIWNDAKFAALSERGKLVLFFLLTHPNLTMLGAMRATIPGLTAELEMSSEAFTKAFQEALSKGIARHDEKAKFVWLPNFLKYNRPESPNVVRSWPEAFDLLPECGLKVQLLQQLKDFIEGLTEGFQVAFAEAFAKSMPNQEQEQEQEYISSNAHASDGDGPSVSQLELLKNEASSAVRNAAVAKVWSYYIEKTARNPKIYAFTAERKRLGLARLDECLKRTAGDLEKATELMMVAVDAIAASDWHMGRDARTNGKAYREWDDHLFKNYKTMERWWNV